MDYACTIAIDNTPSSTRSPSIEEQKEEQQDEIEIADVDKQDQRPKDVTKKLDENSCSTPPHHYQSHVRTMLESTT